MIKLVKSIVDTNRNLIGFMMEGTEREFGGISTEKIIKAQAISELIKMRFANKQVAVVDGKLIEQKDFKINSLPLTVFTGENYIDIDNTVNITKRFVKDNENIGFTLAFADGSTKDFRYKQVIALCKWFKPGNFIIRTSAQNKYFISGKPGYMKLDELPVVTLGEKSKAKRTKSGAKEKDDTVSGTLLSGFDMLDVYDFVDACNGCIINLASEKYKAESINEEVENEMTNKSGFKSLGIGEVANAKPVFNPVTLNINGNFKKVGCVTLNFEGAGPVNITTFIHRNKSIFYKGENHIKQFAIAIPVDKEADVINTLGASLTLSKIKDETITKPLSQVIDSSSLVFYKVDASRLDAISEKKVKESVLNKEELVELLKLRYKLNLYTKAFSNRTGYLKELKVELGNKAYEEVARERKLFGLFSMMSPEYLKMIEDAGIDLYTGAFDVSKALKEEYKSPAKKKSSSSDDSGVSIEYILKGFDAGKVSYKAIKEVAEGKIGKADDIVISVAKKLKEVMDIEDANIRLKEANKIFEHANAKFAETTKKLWLHTASMYLIGNKNQVHTHDASDWIIDTTSRVKTATVYTTNYGLSVKLNGVSI